MIDIIKNLFLTVGFFCGIILIIILLEIILNKFGITTGIARYGISNVFIIISFISFIIVYTLISILV